MNIKIRKMDMSDVQFALKAEMDAFGKTLSEKMLVNEMLHNKFAHYYVALVDDKRAGYVGFWLTEPNAEILNIVVAPAVRRQNVGSVLMDYVIATCKEKNIEMLTLEVRQTNQPAVDFYEKYGFKKEALRKRYYPDGEDALLMVKRIGG